MTHNTQTYMLKRGDKYTVTAYYEEGGYYQYVTPAPKRLKTTKDWTAFKAEIAAHACKHFADRVLPSKHAPAAKKKIGTSKAPVLTKSKKLDSRKQHKYTAKTNPLLRRR